MFLVVATEVGMAHEDGLHVVVGAGPLGLAVARELRRTGEAVRVVTRGGSAGAPPGTEVAAADVSDPAEASHAFEGARVVYQCAAPRYSQWPAQLPALMRGAIAGASVAGAGMVYGDNLYAYGRVSGSITEDLPYRPVGPNSRTRAEVAETLMEACADGKLRAAIGRGSDFFGPHALLSSVGDRVFGRMVVGKPPQVLGDPNVPHTVIFIDDFARGLITLGSRHEALGGVWHVPSAETLTIRRFVELIAEQTGASAKPRVTPSWVLAMLGLFNPDARALREVLYQSENPWVVDHTKFERAFGASPTPHPDAIGATLEWFGARGAH